MLNLLTRKQFLNKPFKEGIISLYELYFREKCTAQRTLHRLYSSEFYNNLKLINPNIQNNSKRIGLQFLRYNSSGTILRDDEHVDNVIVEEDALLFADEILDDDISIRNILYPDYIDTDPIMIKLNKCNHFNEILSEIKENIDNFTKQHFIQSMLVLWDLIRCNRPSLINKQIEQLGKNEIFLDLFNQSKNHFKTMNIDEKCCCMLYYSKLGISLKHNIFQYMLEDTHKIITETNNVPLTALSRFIVTVNTKSGLLTYYLCKDIFPIILDYLNNVQNVDDIRLITIGLINLPLLVTDEILINYKNKILELIDNGQINPDTKKCILRAIAFLNYPRWSERNIAVIRKLMLLIKDKIPTLSSRELEILISIYQSQFEPAEILIPIIEQSEKFLLKSPQSTDLMVCNVTYSLPKKRLEIFGMANEIINSNEPIDMSTLISLFKVLRCLKISNKKICDQFWTKVVKHIEENPLEQDHYRIFRTAHRYMYFNNNLAGTYRNFHFEKYITKCLVDELENGSTKWIPSKYAKLSSFVVAYGHTPNSKTLLPEFIIERLQSMAHQFTIFDCLHISRGLQIALGLRYKNNVSTELAIQLHKMENILNACAERHMDTPNLTLVQLNGIIRSFNNRNISKRTPLFYRLLQKYETINYNELTSRLIRDITFNLNDSNHLITSICEHLLNYVLENNVSISGDIIEKILNCCYNAGYIPPDDLNEVFQIAVQIIQRDFNYMSCLSIIQACLSLSFYHALTNDLINRVFNIDFIKRIEDEIQLCYAKGIYPKLVLNKVMQLNRAVCIDFPEAGVPWFQQNYIEAQMTKLPTIKTKFHYDIKNSLTRIIQNRELLKIDHITPYGYQIDFVLHLNANKELIQPSKTEEFINNTSKIAIILLKSKAFPYNNKLSLRGAPSLKQRHLEILGYKVIQISYDDWNSMYMNIPGAKVNYLKNLLQITNE